MYKEKGQVHIAEIIKQKDVCLPVEATFRQLLSKMNNTALGVIIILQEGRAVGIITERDVVQLMYDNVNLDDGIYAHAQKKLIQTSGRRYVSFALTLMLENNIRRLIVTHEDGSFLGVVTQKDLLQHLEDSFDQTAIKIRHVMTNLPDLISVEKTMAIKDVLHIFLENKISSVPVIEEGKPIGIITEKDILELAAKEVSLTEPVLDHMSAPVFCTDFDAPVANIVHEMNIRNIQRVVVTDEAGYAQGVLTNRDFAKNLDGDFNHFLKLKLKYTKDILNLLPEMLIELVDLGEEQLVIWANDKALSIFGAGFLDRSVTDLIPVDRWREIYTYLGENDKVAEVRFDKDNNIYELSGYYLPIERSEEKGRIQLIIRDITEEVKQAIIDPLTNIFNRRHITNILVKETERSRRFSNTFSIAMIDIDDFKKVNDRHGHVVGDQVLKAFARCVKEKLREYDVIGRYGGEEFLLILPELNPDKAFMVVDRIRHHIHQMEIELKNGLTLQITSSFGVASFPADADSPMDLLIRADEKLYEAKRTGKNKVMV